MVFDFQDGAKIDSLHSYLIWGAIKSIAPEFQEIPNLKIRSIIGTKLRNQTIAINERSLLKIRVPVAYYNSVAAKLSNKKLRVKNEYLLLGRGRYEVLQPVPVLKSRIVVINSKKEFTTDNFLESVCTQLEERDIEGKVSLICGKDGNPIRRVVMVKGVCIPGYGVKVSGLPEQDSLRLQELGIGGRSTMGCGWFE